MSSMEPQNRFALLTGTNSFEIETLYPGPLEKEKAGAFYRMFYNWVKKAEH